MNIRNIKDKTQNIIYSSQVYKDYVNIVGNNIVIFTKCRFEDGLRVTSWLENGIAYCPKLVILRDCEFPSDGYNLPLKISNTATPDDLIDQVILEDISVSGSKKPHIKNDADSGTPDNIGIHHVNKLQLNNVVSCNGGENGYSLNSCNEIFMNNCIASGNDGQGLHIGRHTGQRKGFTIHDGSVKQAIIINFLSTGNWKNQLSVNGSSCGVLLHHVFEANIQDIQSYDNEYVVSDMLRRGSGVLNISGMDYSGMNRILKSSNVKVFNNLYRG